MKLIPVDRHHGVKGVVTAAGVGLIGVELWWFLGSKPQSRKTQTHKLADLRRS